MRGVQSPALNIEPVWYKNRIKITAAIGGEKGVQVESADYCACTVLNTSNGKLDVFLGSRTTLVDDVLYEIRIAIHTKESRADHERA